MTTIVEDTGDIEQIASHSPHSATTNPSLVAAAAADPRYSSLVEEAVRYGRLQHCSTRTEQLALTRDKLFTLFGAEIVRHLAPSAGGDVSTEVDARLSFDIDAQVAVGRRLIKMYEQESGISRDRVLIKLATTWEGIEACRILEREGIRTNMTLLFGLPQAVAAADAGAFLISPFVGRILDWYKKELNVSGFEPASEDPGVKSVREIYQYYKCFGCDTVVMGASFRNIDEIVELAGCDRLTIAPKFITMLKESYGDVERKLATPDRSACETLEKMTVTESSFRWMMNENAMATEKLAHGIRSFAEDLAKLDAQLEKILDG